MSTEFRITGVSRLKRAETVAFGYRARALVFEQRVPEGTFGYPRHAPFSLTAGDGLAKLIHRRGCRSGLQRGRYRNMSQGFRRQS